MSVEDNKTRPWMAAMSIWFERLLAVVIGLLVGALVLGFILACSYGSKSEQTNNAHAIPIIVNSAMPRPMPIVRPMPIRVR